MDEVPITRAYLESLTTSDLNKLADNMGIDIPLELDRIFVIEELLGISYPDDDESGIPPEPDLEDTVLVESAPLPKQYNFTFIEAMIRDPLWAFVFWEIKAQDKEQFEKSPDFDGYYLKVSPYLMPMEKSKDRSLWEDEAEVYTVQVEAADTAWYLYFSPAAEPGEKNEEFNPGQYKVELCVSLKGEETVLAVSNPIKLPSLPGVPVKHGADDQGPGANPLIRLSGYGDFHILRRNERLLRGKKNAPADSYE